MPQILFEINYDIKPDKRDKYLATISELMQHLKSSGKNYFVVEDTSQINNFTEIYICKDEAEYENLEDENDETTNLLTTKILSEFISGSTRYSTKKEIG